MPMLWSELPTARLREAGADIATSLWVAAWTWLGWDLYRHVARTRTIGHTLRQTGTALETVGQRIGEALAQVPVIGPPAGAGVREALSAAGAPFGAAGGDLERFILIVAAALGLLIAGLPIAMWLQRYLPWRLQRLSGLRAAQRAVRTAPRLAAPQVERLLAARAFHRLSYEELLRFTPDPFGDWEGGKYEGLARAELASVGLRSVRSRRRAGGSDHDRGRSRRS